MQSLSHVGTEIFRQRQKWNALFPLHMCVCVCAFDVCCDVCPVYGGDVIIIIHANICCLIFFLYIRAFPPLSVCLSIPFSVLL